MTRSGERGRIGIAFAILGAVVVLLLGGGVATLFFARAQLDAPSGNHDTVVDLEVRAGESLDALTADLDSRGLIRSSFWFSQYGRLRGLADALHAGVYHLDTGMSAGTLISELSGEPSEPRRRVSFAEGLTAEQMGHRLESAGIGISQADYLREVRSGRFATPLLAVRPAGTTLEGFLFPDTYEIPDRATAHDVVQMQLDDLSRRLAALGAPTGGDLYSVVTIASILEREAKFDADRPLVASVIANRLARGTPLQVDATVLYGLHQLGRDSGMVDTQTDTPYNSYLHPGLPPTPISNPGIRALEAAAHPASTAFLYYVSDGCGHNHYATTAQEHARLVAEFVGRPCPGSPAGSASPGG